MGGSWHNNHHAFPVSARLGLAPGEWDPGWWVLRGLEHLALVWSLLLPEDLLYRPGLLEGVRCPKQRFDLAPTTIVAIHRRSRCVQSLLIRYGLATCRRALRWPSQKGSLSYWAHSSPCAKVEPVTSVAAEGFDFSR